MIDKSILLAEKRNSDVFLRPRFEIDLTENADTILEAFKKAFNKNDCAFLGTIMDGHIFISVLKKDEHFWSPQLHLEVIQKTENSASLKGLFGPKPQVWTLFMFIHFLIGISFLIFLVLAYSRYSLHQSIFFPVAILIALPLVWTLLYFLGKIGKDKGKIQMKKLHQFMIQVLENE